MPIHPTAIQRLKAEWHWTLPVTNEWLENLCAHVDDGHPIGEPAAKDLLREVLRLRFPT